VRRRLAALGASAVTIPSEQDSRATQFDGTLRGMSYDREG